METEDKLQPLRRRITEDAGLPRPILGVTPTDDPMPRVVGRTDPLEKHPGLVWREKEIVGDVVQTMRGPMPTMTVERKPDLNLARLAEFAERPPRLLADPDAALAEAGGAILRERKEKNTFHDALRNLVLGIDMQGEDGTWSIDLVALEHAKHVLGIEEEEE